MQSRPIGRRTTTDAVAPSTRRSSKRGSRFADSRVNTRLSEVTQLVRGVGRTAVFLLKVMPMLPSTPIDWVTPRPMVERLRYPTRRGLVAGDLYRPSGGGRHPGIVVCLGVVPFGVDHPQIPRLGAALARSGFAALLYWSPAMRDFRLEPEDIADIASAFDCLLEQPGIEPAGSGLLGTCVGAAFALMAAADPRIRDRVAFVAAFAPYASMWTLARDIASGGRCRGGIRERWPVDPLTRKVFVHSISALLKPEEAAVVISAAGEPDAPLSAIAAASATLSADARVVCRLLTGPDVSEAEAALRALPAPMQALVSAISPLTYLPDVRAPLVVVGHDQDDVVIPVGESRRLRAALAGRRGAHYTEFALFQHADPTKRRLPPWQLLWQLGKFFAFLYPIFRQTVTPVGLTGRRARRAGTLDQWPAPGLPG